MERYTILEANNLTSLIDEVNEYLEKGWTCQGGVSSVKFAERDYPGHYLWGEYYAQAMVKEQ